MYLVAICRRGVLPDHITEFLSLVPVVLPTRGVVYSRLYHGNVPSRSKWLLYQEHVISEYLFGAVVGAYSWFTAKHWVYIHVSADIVT